MKKIVMSKNYSWKTYTRPAKNETRTGNGSGNIGSDPDRITRTGKILRPGPERVGYHIFGPGPDYPDRKYKTRTRPGLARNIPTCSIVVIATTLAVFKANTKEATEEVLRP